MEGRGAVQQDQGEIWTRARRHMLKYGGDFVPFVPVRAEGAFLYDARGRRVLDFTSGQMSAILGHSHPGDRRDRARGGRDAGSSVLLDAERAGGGSGRGAGAAGAGAAEGDAAVHRRRGERGGDQAGQAGDRQLGGGGLRAVLARHDRRRGVGDLQGGAARLWADGGGQFRHSGAERVSAALRRRRLAARSWTMRSSCWTGRAPAISPRSSPSRC